MGRWEGCFKLSKDFLARSHAKQLPSPHGHPGRPALRSVDALPPTARQVAHEVVGLVGALPLSLRAVELVEERQAEHQEAQLRLPGQGEHAATSFSPHPASYCSVLAQRGCEADT